MKILAALILTSLVTPTLTFGASFDCKKAQSATEKLICTDTELTKLDEELHETYQTAKLVLDDLTTFSKVQRKAWKVREKYCRSKTCLKTWYEERTKVLNAVIKTGKLSNCLEAGKLSLKGKVVKKQYEIYTASRKTHTRTSYLLEVNPPQCSTTNPVEVDQIPIQYTIKHFELVGIKHPNLYKKFKTLQSKRVHVFGMYYTQFSQYYFSSDAIDVNSIQEIRH